MLQLKFDVLEFPAVSFCNLNQFRRDRLPNTINSLASDFMDSKREELFGGADAMDEFFRWYPNFEPAIEEW